MAARARDLEGGKVFRRQREGPIITIFGHARSHAGPAQTAALARIPQRPFLPRFSKRSRATGFQEERRSSHPSSTIHTLPGNNGGGGDRAAAVRRV